MEYIKRIVSNPDVMLGKPIIKGTRITVEIILRKMAEGMTNEELLEAYPQITKEDILAAVSYSADVISNEARLRALERLRGQIFQIDKSDSIFFMSTSSVFF